MLLLAALFVACAVAFLRIEAHSSHGFIDLRLFSNTGEKLLQRWGPRRPMLLGCEITALGIAFTTFTFLLAREYIAVAFVGFTLFGVGLGFYATPSTDAALSNVPQDKAGSASGIYKMASSLGAAFGVALSGALFTGLGHQRDITPLAGLFMGRTDNIRVRFAAGVALLFNVFMVLIAIGSIVATVPRTDHAAHRGPPGARGFPRPRTAG